MFDNLLNWIGYRQIFELSKNNIKMRLICKSLKINETQSEVRKLMKKGWFLIQEPNFVNRAKVCDDYPELEQFNLDPNKDYIDDSSPLCSW